MRSYYAEINVKGHRLKMKIAAENIQMVRFILENSLNENYAFKQSVDIEEKFEIFLGDHKIGKAEIFTTKRYKYPIDQMASFERM